MIEPLVDRLCRIGIPRPVSIVLISLVMLMLIVALVLTATPLITEQWATVTIMIGNGYRSPHMALSQSPSLIIIRIAEQLPAVLPVNPAGQQPAAVDPVEAAQQSLAQVEQAFNVGGAIIRNLILMISVLLLTGLWVLEGEVAIRVLLLAVPQARRPNIREFVADIQKKVGAYTRGLAFLLFIIGAMAGIAYVLIGLPNALLLAVSAGVMEIVPLIGPALGVIPALVVAAAVSPSKVVLVLVIYLLIQYSENHFIVPRVMDRTVGVNPVASLLAFIAFGSLFGFLGAVLAVPLAAVIQLALRRFVFDAPPAEQTPLVGRNVISTLRYEAQDLVQDVRKQVRAKESELESTEDRVEDALEAIAQDLDSILAQVENKKENGRLRDRRRATP